MNSVIVEAADEADGARLQQIIDSFSAVPALQIDSRKFLARVESNLAVRKATFEANLFGRATLRVWYRQPLARYGDGLAVDGDGVAFPVSSSTVLQLEIGSKVQDSVPFLTLADSSRLQDCARLAAKLQVEVPKLAGKIDVDGAGRLFLASEDSAVVVFGSLEKIEAKLAILRNELERDQNALKKVKLINLVQPAAPTKEN